MNIMLEVLLYNTFVKTLQNSSGLLAAPTDVEYDIVSVDNVAVSWRPPFTLEGVPILHYSVYITSQGLSEQRNTTETNITLERPCASTTYQISAWNEVGEGNATRKGKGIMVWVYMEGWTNSTNNAMFVF